MAIVIRYMFCLVFISRSSDLIQYGGIVTKANSRDHITPSLLQLHWLPVRWRVQFKLCVIMHCVHWQSSSLPRRHRATCES